MREQSNTVSQRARRRYNRDSQLAKLHSKTIANRTGSLQFPLLRPQPARLHIHSRRSACARRHAGGASKQRLQQLRRARLRSSAAAGGALQ